MYEVVSNAEAPGDTDRHDDIGLVAVQSNETDVGVGQTKTIRSRWNAFIAVTRQSLGLDGHRPDVF